MIFMDKTMAPQKKFFFVQCVSFYCLYYDLYHFHWPFSLLVYLFFDWNYPCLVSIYPSSVVVFRFFLSSSSASLSSSSTISSSSSSSSFKQNSFRIAYNKMYNFNDKLKTYNRITVHQLVQSIFGPSSCHYFDYDYV